MSTAVDYNPKNLDFGLVDPLTSGPDVSTFGEATLPNPGTWRQSIRSGVMRKFS
jgi:hypothetical protein